MLQKAEASHGEAELSWRRHIPAVSLAAIALPALLITTSHESGVAQVDTTKPASVAQDVTSGDRDFLDIYDAKQAAQNNKLKPSAVALTGKIASAVCFTIDPKVLHHTTKQFYGNIQLACELAKDEPWAEQNFKQQFAALVQIWDRESGWNQNALNKSSGAGGIPQAMPKSIMGAAAQHDATKQIEWGLGYIEDRYKDPLGALAHWDAKGWY